MYTFVPNKKFGSLLEISPKNNNLIFQEIEVWFTDQGSQALETEDKTNLNLVIKQYSHYKNEVFMDFYYLLKGWVHT